MHDRIQQLEEFCLCLMIKNETFHPPLPVDDIVDFSVPADFDLPEELIQPAPRPLPQSVKRRFARKRIVIQSQLEHDGCDMPDHSSSGHCKTSRTLFYPDSAYRFTGLSDSVGSSSLVYCFPGNCPIIWNFTSLPAPRFPPE